MYTACWCCLHKISTISSCLSKLQLAKVGEFFETWCMRVCTIKCTRFAHFVGGSCISCESALRRWSSVVLSPVHTRDKVERTFDIRATAESTVSATKLTELATMSIATRCLILCCRFVAGFGNSQLRRQCVPGFRQLRTDRWVRASHEERPGVHGSVRTRSLWSSWHVQYIRLDLQLLRTFAPTTPRSSTASDCVRTGYVPAAATVWYRPRVQMQCLLASNPIIMLLIIFIPKFLNPKFKLLLVFHCSLTMSLYCFRDIQRRITACPWNLG